MNVKSKQTLKQSYFVRQRRREIAFSAFCFALLLGFIAVLPTMGDEEPLQTASVASATSGSRKLGAELSGAGPNAGGQRLAGLLAAV